MSEPGSASPAPQAKRIPLVALLFAASNLLSAGLGYVRESLIAAMFGSTAATDAYFSAFRLPDLLNYFLAGSALSIAFLPRYTKLFVDDREKADRFLGILLGTMGAIVIAVTVGLWLGAGPIVGALFGGFAPETLELTTHLTRIVLPAQIFFVLGGIVKVALFARDRYLAAALAPVIYNVCIIIGGLALGPTLGIEGFAWGALVGAALGALGSPLVDVLPRVKLRLRFAPWDREFLSTLWVAVPLMLGVSLLTVDEWYLNFLGAGLEVGSVSYLLRARLLMRLPVQVVGQAIGAAALPTLTRLWVDGKKDELNRVITTGLSAALGIGLLGAAGLWVLAEPITGVLFERGAFTHVDTEIVAGLVRVLAVAVPFWLAQQLAVRAFYARGDTWRPMILSTVLALGAFPVYLGLRDALGSVGLAMAGATSMAVTASCTMVMARWLHRAPSLVVLLGSVGRGVVIAGLAGAATFVVASYLGAPGRLPTPWDQWVPLVVGVPVFGGVALPLTLWVGDAPMAQALRRLLERIYSRFRST